MKPRRGAASMINYCYLDSTHFKTTDLLKTTPSRLYKFILMEICTNFKNSAVISLSQNVSQPSFPKTAKQL